MKEAPENDKDSSHSARASGMNEYPVLTTISVEVPTTA